MHERVREAIAAPLVPVADRLDELGFDEPVERLLEDPGHGRDGAEERLVEHGPEHGRLLEEPARIGGQPIDAREQQAVERGRDVDGLGRGGTRPAVALPHDDAFSHQAPHDLLDEERIATRPRVSFGESGARRITECTARATSGGFVSGRCERSSISGRSAN